MPALCERLSIKRAPTTIYNVDFRCTQMSARRHVHMSLGPYNGHSPRGLRDGHV